MSHANSGFVVIDAVKAAAKAALQSPSMQLGSRSDFLRPAFTRLELEEFPSMTSLFTDIVSADFEDLTNAFASSEGDPSGKYARTHDKRKDEWREQFVGNLEGWVSTIPEGETKELHIHDKRLIWWLMEREFMVVYHSHLAKEAQGDRALKEPPWKEPETLQDFEQYRLYSIASRLVRIAWKNRDRATGSTTAEGTLKHCFLDLFILNACHASLDEAQNNDLPVRAGELQKHHGVLVLPTAEMYRFTCQLNEIYTHNLTAENFTCYRNSLVERIYDFATGFDSLGAPSSPILRELWKECLPDNCDVGTLEVEAEELFHKFVAEYTIVKKNTFAEADA